MQLLLMAALAAIVTVVRPECTMYQEECEFSIIVEHKLTMMRGNDRVYLDNGKLYGADSYAAIPPDDVITADANSTRLVAVVNGTMPGPTVVVYEDQAVVVHVTNKLSSDTISIHWHGYPQKNSPWMDGASFTTQCPILPGQTFTYRIRAHPKGTYFYHAHSGSMMSMGVSGAFVVRERKQLEMPEHVVVLQDWNNAMEADKQFKEDRTMNSHKNLIDGTFTYSSITSGLINGRGRHNNDAPLESFQVVKGHRYRFRVIGSMSTFAFRVSVDDHKLSLVAIDGRIIKHTEADSFIIASGERFDFILVADQPTANYWIRAETLEDKKIVAQAILAYSGAPRADPVSTKNTCTAASPCRVVNCPFSKYPGEAHIQCVSVDHLREPDDNAPVPPMRPYHFKEHMLNFAYHKTENGRVGIVNGKKYQSPAISLLTQPREFVPNCNKEECNAHGICECTQSISLTKDDTVQFVFTNIKSGIPHTHPIHMHGHTFHILKVGYPKYDASGRFSEPTSDIECLDDPEKRFCNQPVWADRSWYGDNIPGLNLERAPRKDTIFVPAGGYVVVRIKADNPGLWNLHCHMESHNMGGMNILLNESFSEVPVPPPGFPQCRNFPVPDWLLEKDPVTNPVPTPPSLSTNPPGISDGPRVIIDTAYPNMYQDAVFTRKEFWGMCGVLVGIILIQFLVAIGVLNCVHSRTSRRANTGVVDVPPYKA